MSIGTIQYILRGGYSNSEVHFWYDPIDKRVMMHQITNKELLEGFSMSLGGAASQSIYICRDKWYPASTAETVWNAFVGFKSNHKDWKPWVRVVS